uniref:Shikimate kinase n=2 Tax=Phaeomonas parva TaxID=124430 RepID=A0A7S1TYN8_9STRA|mmetsp:Transcript_23964/g.75456  ORF Transcript_23964/g.75456 Transcript_23964/m.75456 type:complete len:183 (+) Transcript_23964:174-722(+)
MMGTGKSTAGKELAKRMGGYSFLDTDTVIEAYAGRDCATIFEEEGEEAFRDIETMVMDQACAYKRLCVATGGGMVLRTKNWSKMQTGIVVWLNMDPADIAERLSASSDEVTKRPLLAEADPAAKLTEILDERRDRYAIADITLDMTKDDTVDDVVRMVCSRVHSFIDKNPPRFTESSEYANQ